MAVIIMILFSGCFDYGIQPIPIGSGHSVSYIVSTKGTDLTIKYSGETTDYAYITSVNVNKGNWKWNGFVADNYRLQLFVYCNNPIESMIVKIVVDGHTVNAVETANKYVFIDYITGEQK